MRSRFSAFALGLGMYLVTTLGREHPDRAGPEVDLARALAQAKDQQRFLDLVVLDTREADGEGEVLFFARIFSKGVDRSFAELSTFQKENGKWRYVSGLVVPAERLPQDIRELTRERFLALYGV